MFKVAAADFKVDFSDYDFHAGFHGVAGDECGKCKATVNISIPGPGWFCVCGYYNISSWSDHRMMYDNPTYGYGAEYIKMKLKPAFDKMMKSIADSVAKEKAEWEARLAVA